MQIPTELLPRCPQCGKLMTMNLRSDERFVEDGGWHLAARRYEDFLRGRKGQHMLLLELGVGYNTPVIIKYPFWRMTLNNRKAVYACINLGQAAVPRQIEDRSICINDDIGTVIEKLLLRAECVAHDITFCFIETGTHFIKDGKHYHIPKKQVQSRMAHKSGMNYQGKPIEFDLTDGWGYPIPEEDLYVPHYGKNCAECGSKLICNGCADCGRCNK